MYDANQPEFAKLPGAVRAALDAYARDRIEPSGSVLRILQNDFVGVACSGIDPHAMRAIALYVWNQLPGECHGSREAVAEWLGGGRDRR